MKKEEKLRATDSNPYTVIRISHKKHEEKTEVRIRIPYIAIDKGQICIEFNPIYLVFLLFITCFGRFDVCVHVVSDVRVK